MTPQPTAIKREIATLERALENNPECQVTLDLLLDAEERLIQADAFWIAWQHRVNHKDHRGGGPRYPALPGLNKFRKAAKRGTVDVNAYGAAVGEAILALQRKEAERGIVEHRPCPCASGTWHTEAKDIERAIRAQHVAACARQVQPLDMEAWQVQRAAAYGAAMAEKRKREAAAQKATKAVLERATLRSKNVPNVGTPA